MFRLDGLFDDRDEVFREAVEVRLASEALAEFSARASRAS
jgi:hypothetical protein